MTDWDTSVLKKIGYVEYIGVGHFPELAYINEIFMIQFYVDGEILKYSWERSEGVTDFQNSWGCFRGGGSFIHTIHEIEAIDNEDELSV